MQLVIKSIYNEISNLFVQFPVRVFKYKPHFYLNRGFYYIIMPYVIFFTYYFMYNATVFRFASYLIEERLGESILNKFALTYINNFLEFQDLKVFQ